MIRVALAVVALAGVAHADMDASDALQRIEDSYKKPQTLTTTFDQTVTNSVTGQIGKSKGAIFAAKPDKIRFEYLKTKNGATKIDVVQLFDGKTGWYIDHGGTQYWRQTADASSLPAAVSFFLGAGTLSKEFRPAFAAAKGPHLQLELTPIKPNAAYAKVVLAVDSKALSVSKVTITNSSGVTTELAFAKLETDKTFPDKTFVVDPKTLAGYKQITKP